MSRGYTRARTDCRARPTGDAFATSSPSGSFTLPGLEDRALAPLWNRAGALLFRHGEHFYNFEGLRRFKQKFHPEWEPRYLASPGGLALPRALTDVAALVSGGLRGVIGK